MAAKFKIFQKEDGTWSVPSQTGKGGRYTIHLGDRPKCNCAFHEENGANCKHIFAVEYFIRKEQHEDGSETVTESFTVKRKTYPLDPDKNIRVELDGQKLTVTTTK